VSQVDPNLLALLALLLVVYVASQQRPGGRA
jgi:hypothetical protein